MITWITSDVHLGSRQCRAEWFLAFLRQIPREVRLVLNGDVVTRFKSEARMPASHRAVLQQLREMSREQSVIWLGGNHDNAFELEGQHAVARGRRWTMDHDLYIEHGDHFDHLMPSIRFLLLPVKVVYECCTRVLGSRTHVTDFAKRFPSVYRVLNQHVIAHATAFAAKEGYCAITCGHTHHPEDLACNGVQYYNTGCWTEDAAHVLVVGEDGKRALRRVAPDGALENRQKAVG